MSSAVRPPRCVSLSELFTEGYLTQEDIQSGGYVMESTRILAEQNYANRHANESPPRASTRNGDPHPSRRRSPGSVQPQRDPVSGESDAFRRMRETFPPTDSQHGRHQTSLLRGRPAEIQMRRGMTPDERQRVPEKWSFDTCCVCYCRDKDHAARPCFHMCVCRVCSTMLTRCPLCRVPVTSFQRIFS